MNPSLMSCRARLIAGSVYIRQLIISRTPASSKRSTRRSGLFSSGTSPSLVATVPERNRTKLRPIAVLTSFSVDARQSERHGSRLAKRADDVDRLFAPVYSQGTCRGLRIHRCRSPRATGEIHGIDVTQWANFRSDPPTGPDWGNSRLLPIVVVRNSYPHLVWRSGQELYQSLL